METISNGRFNDVTLYYGFGEGVKRAQLDRIGLIPMEIQQALPDYPSAIVPAHVADGGTILSVHVPRSLCDIPLLLDVPEPVM